MEHETNSVVGSDVKMKWFGIQLSSTKLAIYTSSLFTFLSKFLTNSSAIIIIWGKKLFDFLMTEQYGCVQSNSRNYAY